MILNLALTADQVKRAVETVKKIRPAYKEMLDFFGRIFAAQAELHSLLLHKDQTRHHQACVVLNYKNSLIALHLNLSVSFAFSFLLL